MKNILIVFSTYHHTKRYTEQGLAYSETNFTNNTGCLDNNVDYSLI